MDPEMAAQVVNLVKDMEQSPEIIDNLGVLYYEDNCRIGSHRFNFCEIDPSSDPKVLYEFCSTLIKAVPDGGNTPKIAAFLLKNYHEAMCVLALLSPVGPCFVTSTTSKNQGH